MLIFFLFGPLLTLGIGTAALVRKLPSNAAHWEYELAKQTGIHWTIQHVEYRSPGVVRLKKVRIIDDAADNSVFFAPEITIKQHRAEPRELLNVFPNIDTGKPEKNNGTTGLLDALVPTASTQHYYQITVPASLLTLEKFQAEQAEFVIKDTLSRLCSRLPFLTQTPMLLEFDDCGVVRSKAPDSKPEHFRNVKGNLYKTAADFRSDWAFQLPEVSDLELQKLTMVKKRSGSTMELTLRTGKRTVPCEIAGVFCAPFRALGTGARFSGTFAVECADQLTLRLDNAMFVNVDLAVLAAQYAPQSVSGTVLDLQIHQAVFGGGMFSAQGCTHIVNGTADKALFQRLLDQFQLSLDMPEILNEAEQRIAFDGCAIHFKLQPDGIVFWGDERWRDGKLLMYRESNALRTPPTQAMCVSLPTGKSPPISYHSVLSVFAPDDAPVVPLTPGLQRLVGSLPVSVPKPQPPLVPADSSPMVAAPK